MAERITTVEQYGDDAITDALLSGDWPAGFDGVFYDDKVIYAGPYCFYQNQVIKEIDFPNITRIGEYAFYKAGNLKKLSAESCTYAGTYSMFHMDVIEEINLPKLYSAGQHIFGYSGMKELELPAMVQTTEYLCEHNTNLVTVKFPIATYIAASVLRDCKALKNLYVPEALIFRAPLIGCSSIERVDLPKVQNLQTNSFAQCTSLKEINIGPDITAIEATGFAQMPDGVNIYMAVPEESISGAPWGGTGAIFHYDHPYLSQYE